MSLIAREFERHGTPTLILGSALDILRSGGPPRVQFLNYPLGYTAGKPFDQENQRLVLSTAVKGFDRMQQPGIERLDFEWPDGWTMVAQRSLEDSGSDLRSPRDTQPRYQTEADRVLAESIQSGIR